MAVGDSLPIVNNRECGNCTKCCDGIISGEAKGHSFGNKVPCFFVESGVGCTIYEDRPVFPCQKFKCQWLENPDIPEEFKPDVVDFLTVRKGRSYFVIAPAGDNPSVEYVEWMKNYVTEKGYSLSYRYKYEDDPMFIGSERLRQTLGYSQKDQDPNMPTRDARLELKRLEKEND